MKSKLLITTFILFVSLSINAQQNLVWAKKMSPGNNFYAAPLLASDNNNNIYNCQAFTGTIDVDPGPSQTNLSSQGQEDFYISKLDGLGNLVWAKKFGGSQSETVSGFVADTSGNCYVIGTFSNSFDADPSSSSSTLLTSAGFNDVFVIKIDSSGSFVWAASFGGSMFDGACSVSLDNFNNLYVYGLYFSTIDADPGASNVPIGTLNNMHMSIIKLNSSGQFILAAENASMSSNGAFGVSFKTPIAFDNLNNIYVAGVFNGSFDANPGTSNTNVVSNGSANDIFIQKLDPNFNLLWVKKISSSSVESLTAISADINNNVILLGSYQNTLDIDPGTGVFNLPAVTDADFLVKLDNNGNFVTGREFQEGIAVRNMYKNSVDNFYFTGYYSGSVTFTDGSNQLNVTSNGATDYFVYCLNSSMQLNWLAPFYGNNEDAGENIIVDAQNNLIISGSINDTICFSNSVLETCIAPINQGTTDVLLHKMSETNATTIKENKLDEGVSLFPNPAEDLLIINSVDFIEEISVSNSIGKIVCSTLVSHDKHFILNLQSMDAGIYFVKLKTKTAETTKKIIVAK
jgi:hypothetical protein